MNSIPFAKSNLGFLEYEICSLLQCTPKELGDKRERDPDGVAFLEQHLIHRRKQEYDARKEVERKSKSRKPHRKR